MTSGGLVLAVLGLTLLSVAPVASAQEGAAPPQGTLRLNLLNPRIAPPEWSSRDLLGSDPPPARQSPEWTILPDGSARYGTESFGVIVSPQCLPPRRSVDLPGRPVR